MKGNFMDWTKIKTEYITTDISCRKLAEKYNCSASSVLQRCKAEKWVEGRNQFHIKSVSKTKELCSDKYADSSAKIYECAEMILERLKQSIETLSIEDIPELHACTRTLKDLMSIFNIKSDLDRREQELRIEILKKQTNDTQEDRFINVVFSSELKDYAN